MYFGLIPGVERGRFTAGEDDLSPALAGAWFCQVLAVYIWNSGNFSEAPRVAGVKYPQRWLLLPDTAAPAVTICQVVLSKATRRRNPD